MDAITTIMSNSRFPEKDKEKIQHILETLAGCSYVRAVSILEECKTLMGYLPTTRTVEEMPQ